ncbi:restriction endonuclease [Hymenobacter terrigena]
MEKTSSTFQKFEVFIEKLLKTINFKVIHNLRANNIDLFANWEAEDIATEKFAIIVKLYTTKNTDIKSIERAAYILSNAININHIATRGILITSSIVEPLMRTTIEDKAGVIIIDRNILHKLTDGKPSLRSELDDVLLETKQLLAEDIYTGLSDLAEFDFNQHLKRHNRILKIDNILLDEGENLSRRLANILPGREDAASYEKLCQAILEHLFAEDFDKWTKQNTTTDGLHRFDLIAKIKSDNDVIRSLGLDFNSRFLIFEFKNYQSTIKQKEIYSTEKYLYHTAFRRIAIIISRKGASTNANKAICGALRESGKLIISLSDDDLKEMLKLKDNAGDYHKIIADRVDEVLMTLSK